MEDASRASLMTNGRETMDVMIDERQEYERQMLQMESELRHCKQVISSLSCVNSTDAGQKLVETVMESNKIREELDERLKAVEKIEAEKRELMRTKDDEINALKRQLLQTETERDQFLKKCQDWETNQAQDESRFYQQQLEGRPTERSQLIDRVQQRINQEAQDSHLGGIFNQMDQTEVASQIFSQTQETATNLEKHANNLMSYQSNIATLYEQLKHTAKFLSDIIHSLGLENSQTELLMQKINKLHLDLRENNEVSEKMVSDTKKMAGELSEISMRMEESIRNSMMNPNQTSFIDRGVSDELVAKNLEMAQEIDQLAVRISELKTQLGAVEEARDNFEHQVSAAVKDKKALIEKFNNAMKLVEERDDELKNRENIIGELQSVASQKTQLPINLEKEIEAQLGKIYSTLSNVNNKLHKKI